MSDITPSAAATAAARCDLAHRACITAQSLAAQVQRLAIGADADDEEVIRQLAIRIEQVTSVAMSALNEDDGTPLHDLEGELYGPQWARERTRQELAA